MILTKELKLLAIGTVVTFTTFLVASYFGSFMTKEAYAKDKTDLQVMKSDIGHIRQDIREIKEYLK